MTAAAGMAQVNIRMDPDLKTGAEARIAELGGTPTQVVRGLYRAFEEGIAGISRIFHDLAEVVFWTEDEQRELDRMACDKGEEFSRGVEERYRRFYLEIGLDPDNLPEFPEYTDEELYMMYWDDRERERGLGKYAR